MYSDRYAFAVMTGLSAIAVFGPWLTRLLFEAVR